MGKTDGRLLFPARPGSEWLHFTEHEVTGLSIPAQKYSPVSAEKSLPYCLELLKLRNSDHETARYITSDVHILVIPMGALAATFGTTGSIPEAPHIPPLMGVLAAASSALLVRFQRRPHLPSFIKISFVIMIYGERLNHFPALHSSFAFLSYRFVYINLSLL